MTSIFCAQARKYACFQASGNAKRLSVDYGGEVATLASGHPPTASITHHSADKAGDPEIVRESQRRRYGRVEIVDEIIALDQEWRTGKLFCKLGGKPSFRKHPNSWRPPHTVKFELDQANKEVNAISKEIGTIKKVCML